MANRRKTLLWRIRLLLVFFMACVVLSGFTAVPLGWEVERAADALSIPDDASPDAYTGLRHWIATVREGLRDTYAEYPFIAYGTDWLAFAHVVIAVAFIGPLIDPLRNAWVITFGMIACVLVIPMALVFGHLRGIPFYWQLIDCSFGVFGLIPLWLCRRYAGELAQRTAPRRSS
jgi:hypothetical protein